jgi:hypothetical protein
VKKCLCIIARNGGLARNDRQRGWGDDLKFKHTRGYANLPNAYPLTAKSSQDELLTDIGEASGTKEAKCIGDRNRIKGSMDGSKQIVQGLWTGTTQEGCEFAESVFDREKSGEKRAERGDERQQRARHGR